MKMPKMLGLLSMYLACACFFYLCYPVMQLASRMAVIAITQQDAASHDHFSDSWWRNLLQRMTFSELLALVASECMWKSKQVRDLVKKSLPDTVTLLAGTEDDPKVAGSKMVDRAVALFRLDFRLVTAVAVVADDVGSDES